MMQEFWQPISQIIKAYIDYSIDIVYLPTSYYGCYNDEDWYYVDGFIEGLKKALQTDGGLKEVNMALQSHTFDNRDYDVIQSLAYKDPKANLKYAIEHRKGNVNFVPERWLSKVYLVCGDLESNGRGSYRYVTASLVEIAKS